MTEGGDGNLESLVIRNIVRIAGLNKDLAERLVAMPFTETVEGGDWILLETLGRLIGADLGGVEEVLALPELENGITDAQSAKVPLLYLELREPEVAAAMKELPWIQDGIASEATGGSSIEPDTIAALQDMAVEFPQVFWAVMGRPWMQETEENVRVQVIGYIVTPIWGRVQIVKFIKYIAQVDEAAAAQIAEAPFLESIDADDERTLQTLLRLFREDLVGARKVLSDPAVRDGPESITATTIALTYLKTQSPEMSAAIEALPWVRDGIEPAKVTHFAPAHPTKSSLEFQVVQDLLALNLRSREVSLALLQSSWVHDGIDRREHLVLISFDIVSNKDQQAALQIIEMPFLKTIERNDLTIAQFFETLAMSDLKGLRRLLADPALRGGITDDRRATVAWLYLKVRKPGAAAAMESLPWVQDGLASSEESAVFALQELGVVSQRVFRAVVSKPWMQDGLNFNEVNVVHRLRSISQGAQGRSGEATALRILDMPFLETINGVDAAAMRSLSQLFHTYRQDYLHKILSHPTMRDGITDDQALFLSVMGFVTEDRRVELLDTLLDPAQVFVEKRSIQLPHSGEVDLSVVRISPGTYRTMDILEQVLRSQEEFMGTRFPRSYVALLVADVTSARGGGGPGGMMTIDPGYEEDRDLIAHELAHTYWPFSPRWIAEGGAEFMTTISANTQFSSNDCSLADSLSAMERLAEEGVSGISICYYTLGRGLFLELYETLGDEAFREGFRRLYLKMRDEVHFGECTGLERGICYVRAAFVADATPESAALAAPVITRWYEGPVP